MPIAGERPRAGRGEAAWVTEARFQTRPGLPLLCEN